MHAPAEALHTGLAFVQSGLTRHSTQEPLVIVPVAVVAHTGVGAAHSVLAVQPRHVSSASVPDLSHTGVAPAHAVPSAQCTHSPFLMSAGSVAQIGVAPEHWALDMHAEQPPPVASTHTGRPGTVVRQMPCEFEYSFWTVMVPSCAC